MPRHKAIARQDNIQQSVPQLIAEYEAMTPPENASSTASSSSSSAASSSSSAASSSSSSTASSDISPTTGVSMLFNEQTFGTMTLSAEEEKIKKLAQPYIDKIHLTKKPEHILIQNSIENTKVLADGVCVATIPASKQSVEIAQFIDQMLRTL